MLFTNLFTYLNTKTVRRVTASILLLMVLLAPVQNVLLTPTVSVAQAQSTSKPTSWCANESTCLTYLVYIFTVYLPVNFAYATAYLFNGALQLALNSASYALDFLSAGWTIVRDIANLTFIFILIYIAYTIIMRADTSGTMHMLAGVVVMALLINFSFFITRAVIDAGNILSIQFYNAIDVTNSIPSPLGTKQCPPDCIKDLTAGIMDAVKVQGILGTDSFQKFMSQGSGLGTFAQNVLVQILVFVSVGIFLSLLGFIFLIVGIKFLVRVVVLWLMIIASPLAFAAQAVPNKEISKYFKYWLGNLIQSAFFPAIFLFLFFIMTKFLRALADDKGIVPNIFGAIAQINSTGAGSVEAGIGVIANIGIRMGLVIVLLYFTLKASDAISFMGSSVANNVASWTGNQVAGTSGWFARNSAGRLANTAARSETVRSWAASNPLLGGRLASRALNGVATSTLDVRGVSGLRTLAGKAGVGLSGPTGKGGYRQQEADKAKAAEKFAKSLKSDPVYIKTNAERAGMRAYEKDKGEGSVSELKKILKQGAEETQRSYEANFDKSHGAGAFQQKLVDLEQKRIAAEERIAHARQDQENATKKAKELALAGNTPAAQILLDEAEQHKASAAEAEKERSAHMQELDKERGMGKELYGNATNMLGGGFTTLGGTTINQRDTNRIYKVADYEESRRFGNAYIPSVGNIEGAEKMRSVASGKGGGHDDHNDGHDDHTDHDDHASAGESHGDSHGNTKDTGHHDDGHGHGGGHGGGHHMTLAGIRSASGAYGGNQAAFEEILEKLKRANARLEVMQKDGLTQGTRTASMQQNISALRKTLQEQPPVSSGQTKGPAAFGTTKTGSGTLRPATGSKIVPGADPGMQRRMPQNRQGTGNSFSMNEAVPPPPPNNPQNPPKTS